MYRVRGGWRDGDTVEHVENGWRCNGADWTWRGVLRWLIDQEDVWFEVQRAPQRCALPGCVQAVTGRAVFCKPAHQVAAGRLDGRWDYGN